ncbi:haloacid dehalogenase superfamily protein, subfamily IA, variant 3 with third motif having DD or ED [Hoeflea sp. IMCC20628]|uniref:HAD family hydrolase n=1 Tax=Hoeflea sp. IMCC20628 TaxID=1620421 RepID=UPI00063AE80F|nr:HAD family phosphatase [Hoeflea sp. IMCC20628]AKI01462.1 haloacid dehalogenase superfamily protein, subfamily IA, variant 3 with third motif having DD or ED [Hoeflea sp. IMCC20628]
MSETTRPVRHIVFDIGKVLIHYDPNTPFSRLIPNEAERNEFFATVCTHEWNLEQDRGRSWADAEALLIEEFPDKADLIRAFRTHWHEMVSHAYDGSVDFMLDLIQQGRDVTMLTNFAADTFKQAREIYPFLKVPRGVTVSGEIGLIKPDRAIYETHAKSFDLDPAACLFIDDSQKNVDGAIAAGWQSVLFTDPETLREDVTRLISA